jgi:hypothetical protein
MTKTITMTYLLKNPAKVREMVEEGIELLVKFEGKVVMQISLPKKKVDKELPPMFKSGKKKYIFNRDEIYDQEK